MQSSESGLIFSATDLSNFLACPHLTLLSRRSAMGGIKAPRYPDPGLDALRARGLLHEQRFLADLQQDGSRRVVEIADGTGSYGPERWRTPADETTAAMRAGADVIYQGVLFDGRWMGKSDFLLKVEKPSVFGPWSYEIADTKLARSAKGGALLQVLLYADLLAGIQQTPSEWVHLALGGPDAHTERFRVADYAAYFRSVRRRFLAWLETSSADLPIAADPVEHCDTCDWSTICDAERRSVDHLSLVAGIGRNQRRVLTDRGIASLESLAVMTLPADPPIDISRTTLQRIHGQAAIQLQGRRANAPLHELLQPVTAEQGLAALPEPDDGDLFFDLEGDPYALDDGLEYLFGYTDRAGTYTAVWSFDRAQEKKTFEDFIDFVMQRIARHPGMHIYHYAPYEPTALKRLMGRYATREDEVDRLLRGKVLVDLYRVVRQGMRASVESYSIKKMEPFYGYNRDVDLRDARAALSHFEAWLELGMGAENADALQEQIRGYNRDDCISTLRLAEWLESLRSRLAEQGVAVPRPAAASADAGDAAQEDQNEVDALAAMLTDGVPVDPAERSPDQQARWLLAQLLGFHRREKKSTWWEYFRCLGLDAQEVVEDRATLGGLTYEGVVDEVRNSLIHRYRFPPQEHEFRTGDKARDQATEANLGEVMGVDDVARTIDLKRGRNNQVAHPAALVPFDDMPDRVLSDSLIGIAQAVVTHGFGEANPFRSSIDMLLAVPPRAGQQTGESLARPGETITDAGRRMINALDRSVLPLQGPPGAGKTYTGARMIVHALQAGKRVGVTATSHKVIGNLLSEVCRAAKEIGFTVSGMQKGSDEQKCGDIEITATSSNAEIQRALANGRVTLAAGTAWLWSREEMRGSVDILFIDEAGQFSLANALAVAPAASSLVLLGDPQQLEQPLKGVHPPGVAASALQHLLGSHATIPPEQGLFLPETWRLHPDICAFTSEIYYDDRLASREGCELQRVIGPDPFHGTGLRFVPVQHAGNSNESQEEVEEIARVYDMIVGTAKWIDKKGENHTIELSDILVVAPYNAQVTALKARLQPGARVGTVDKFQGQEAPIVIYSMTTSSADDAPRGMQFLYNTHRLNVATSRARCLAIVVASPLLFAPDCRTPEQMRLANGLCRFAEMAT